MFLKMIIRETLTKTVRSLLRKQKQHRDLQRRGVREEPPGGARCSVLRRRRGLQGFWQRGSPGSGRGCSCRCRHPPPSPPAVGVRVAAVVLRRRRVDHVGISRGLRGSAENGVARKWSSPPFSRSSLSSLLPSSLMSFPRTRPRRALPRSPCPSRPLAPPHAPSHSMALL